MQLTIKYCIELGLAPYQIFDFGTGLAPFSFDRQYLLLCGKPVVRKRKRLFLRPWRDKKTETLYRRIVSPDRELKI
ncbi:MAG: hypothetical protein KKC66_02345 [Candidatus Omnitrophica bacterium]|nr:hypothetical protein [Candidatus Omnitrophota bacterium]MBU1932723.1 hypothetical protein [Candidatus Omnitrophota bacterium]